ncbi:MAG: hypothetical protein FJY97_00215 [candidate division Zixibacteria bacterium]|nr:hypothetical protein [candidate division Zixibacteria bacterium]
MQYAFISFSTLRLTLDEMCAVARRFGYAGIEPRMDAGHAHGVETGLSAGERARHRDIALRHGVTLACLATSLKYADAANNPRMIADTLECIDLAGDLGIPVLRVFGGAIPMGV